MNDKILYEIYRLQLLNSIILQCNINPSKWDDYKCVAYACQKRIYPLFNIDDGSIFHTFENDVYILSREITNDIVHYLNDIELQNLNQSDNSQSLTFYDLERRGGGRENRMAIILFLEYCKLDGRFDWFCSNLSGDGRDPAEALCLIQDFDFTIDDIQLDC